ncbi:GSCOCG00001212001-RA-CDS [Cotesia congregata]|nr:GSCOCG00001212001-RA-CDS [Cotesia congregata]
MSLYIIVKGIFNYEGSRTYCHSVEGLDIALQSSFNDNFHLMGSFDLMRSGELPHHLSEYQKPMCEVLNFFAKNGYRVISSTYAKAALRPNKNGLPEDGMIWTLEKKMS